MDYQNPSLEILEAFQLAAALVEKLRIFDAAIDKLPSYSTNCKGGLYILPYTLVSRLVQPRLYCSEANENLIYTGDLRVDCGIARVNAVIAASI